MNLKIKVDRILAVELLIVLLITNYMLVTIICNDNFVFKYMRDCILLFLIIVTNGRNYRKGNIWNRKGIVLNIMIFSIMFMVAMFHTSSSQVGLITFRKYFFPLAFLYVLTKMNLTINYRRIIRFVIVFFTIISFWGIFQAIVLGDSFLKSIGYPVTYSNYYQREMLYNSFYFGGLGIQRVSATFSSSNSCALALGFTLILLMVNNEYVAVKRKKIYYLLLTMAFVLTFSRSNFLAMIIVVLFLGAKYVPYKKQICIVMCGAVVTATVIGIFQGQNGIIYKLLTWVGNSLKFIDSSAAGRRGIWIDALMQVLKSPFGIGLGHVGSVATNTGVSDLVFSCENSYLTIALDTGWLGLISYVGFMIALFRYLLSKRRKYEKENDNFGYKLCTSASMIVFYLMVAMFFSNHIQNMETMCLFYMYVGLALSYNGSIKVGKGITKTIF